ncbi:MAG: metallophosphoesterase [Lacipirellulaceae bacterium]
MFRPVVALVVCLVAALSPAHEGHDHPAGDHLGVVAEQPAAPQFPAALVLPALEGARPWSSKPVLNHPDRFQIAIMTDNTGGHRPGVWLSAVRKLNLLRPEFVVSVGDLIEGYTEDDAELERQWAEFLGFIDELQMRFFFVAGNHDTTNPRMHALWRKKFGAEWYSFDYKGVHFLCLNSEDPATSLGPEQLAFVREDLAKHAGARWTLVFLHKPLWTTAEAQVANDGKDRTGWKEVEAQLADRPHTVFSGHIHHYVQFSRQGREYYALATTGGGSQLRGEAYGEFDHVTWLTMEPDGPRVANLKLDGILTPDVVTERSAERFGRFLRRAKVEVAPIFVGEGDGTESAHFSEGVLAVRLQNRFGEHVELTGTIDGLPLRGLTVEPEAIQLGCGPTGVAEQSVRLRFEQPIAVDDLQRANFTAKLRTRQGDAATGEGPLSAELSIPIVIDRRHDSPLVGAIEVDGVIPAWPGPAYKTPNRPLVLGSPGSWQGPSDASLEVATAHDDERLYLLARVTDDRVASGDFLELMLDGRPLEARRADPNFRWQGARVRVTPPVGDAPAKVTARVGRGRRSQVIEGVVGAVRRTQSGYDVEVSLPTTLLDRAQAGKWESFQMAGLVRDVDDPNGPAADVLWRGTGGLRERNTNFAQFVRATKMAE